MDNLPFIIVIIFLASVGLFYIVCAVMNYDWFINRTDVLLKLLGRNLVRIFYIIVGIISIIFSVAEYLQMSGVLTIYKK